MKADTVMRVASWSHTATAANIRTQAVAVPCATALAIRPHPISGEAQALVLCHLGICPLHLNDANDYVRLDGPLSLRNHHNSSFNIRNVHDAAYDKHSGLVLFAHGTSIYGMDADNRVARLMGDDEGGSMFDGPASDARFVGAQRLTPDGRGVTYIRDRDASSRNGFCLRALHEISAPHGSGGCGVRAVVTVNIGGDMGPHVMTYDSCRRSLLFTKRGRAVHQLLSYGITQETLGTDEPIPPPGVGASAAVASASASISETSDDDDDAAGGNGNGTGRPGYLPTLFGHATPFTNIQALAADPSSGNVYILDGTSGSKTMLRVMRPDGSLDTVERHLRIGPAGSSCWPRLAVLPYGHLAVFGTSTHEMMLLKIGERSS